MYDIIEYKDINENYILFDLRTHEEYDDFHIPGAISLPILDFDERKIVGTLYDNGEKDLAKSKALDFGSKKISEIHQQILSHSDKKIVFYCSRGGFRSKTVSALFFSLGYDVHQLKGGIKYYRSIVNDELPELLNNISLITLYGPTGSGKSNILNIIKNNFPIIDLEMLANHKGSVLGSIGMGKPNSQKMFEAYLYDLLKNSNDDEFLIEGESKRIGDIVLPEILWEKMQISKKIYINSPIDCRIKRLVESYASNNPQELLCSIKRIEKYLSKENFQEIVNSLMNHNYEVAAKILCEKYYDHNYKFKPNNDTMIFENEDDADCANEILNYVIKNTHH